MDEARWSVLKGLHRYSDQWRVSRLLFCSFVCSFATSLLYSDYFTIFLRLPLMWCLRMLLGINWHQHVRNDEVRRLTKQPHLSAIVQPVPVQTHCTNAWRNRCKTDLNSFPRRKLDETTGTSSYYMDENHSAGSEIQRPQYGRRSWPGSEPFTLEIDVDTFGATHS